MPEITGRNRTKTGNGRNLAFRFVRALGVLDGNERTPSLRVHELQGDMAGTWSASASDELRMTFLRAAGGRKLMLTCSRHYA